MKRIQITAELESPTHGTALAMVAECLLEMANRMNDSSYHYDEFMHPFDVREIEAAVAVTTEQTDRWTNKEDESWFS